MDMSIVWVICSAISQISRLSNVQVSEAQAQKHGEIGPVNLLQDLAYLLIAPNTIIFVVRKTYLTFVPDSLRGSSKVRVVIVATACLHHLIHILNDAAR